MKVIFLLAVLLSTCAFADGISIEELKMTKRFGVGVAAAGGFAMMGIEVDFNITETFSISGGIGTGLDYNTFNVKGRYYLLGKAVSPYIGAGLARWWSPPTDSKNLGPSVLVNKFIDSGTNIAQDGFSAYIIYPCVGVQFMHPLGIEFSLEAEYLFKVASFANGTYAGLGVHWYF
jgi:hypothetical protein